jgi:GGDEF domain-containing protein
MRVERSSSSQRSRMDTLIRSYAAQDSKTGLNNRLFFDNQLATLLIAGELQLRQQHIQRATGAGRPFID